VFVALGVQGEMRMRHIVICTNDHVEANKYFDNRNQFYQRAVKTHRRATPWLKAILSHAIPEMQF